MIPCYSSHLTLRPYSLQVVFHLFNISKVVLSCTREGLQIFQSKFSWFPAISLLFRVSGSCSSLSGSCSSLSGSCSCSCLYDGGNKNRAKLSPAESWNWGWAWQYSHDEAINRNLCKTNNVLLGYLQAVYLKCIRYINIYLLIGSHIRRSTKVLIAACNYIWIYKCTIRLQPLIYSISGVQLIYLIPFIQLI